MKTIIFATGNAGKMKEVREILGDLPVKILSMREAGVETDPEETGSTFRENALTKARSVAERIGKERMEQEGIAVLADDSGLVIDALDGQPGVHSARFMGHDTSYRVKNAELLRRLEGVPKERRTARFVCSIAVVRPDGSSFVKDGTIEGKIGYEERGEGGFGYDPIFYLPDFSRSTAELSAEEKNAISHRGNALRAVRRELEEQQ